MKVGLILIFGLLVLTATSSAALRNRYSFNEPPGSTVVIDSVSGSNGVARVLSTTGGAVPSFDGNQVTLDGVGGYIDLPNGLVSGLTNVTFEMWVTWTSGGIWTRLLDFGNNSNGEDTNGTVPSGTGTNYLFITATAGYAPRLVLYTHRSGAGDYILPSSTNLTQGSEHHFVVTYGPSRQPAMYIDGQQVAVAIEAYFYPLSTVQDVNDWLGRANWGMDPFFGGSFNEFRIYDTMLGQLQVLVDYHCGPDLIGCSPETPTSITLNVISNMITGTVQDVTVTAVFPTYGTVTVGGSEVTITSSASNIVSVGTNNRLTAVSPGVATITASLILQTNSATVTVAPPAVYTALKHRYSFNEPAGSTNVTDSIGGPLYNGIVYPPMTNTVAPVVISNGVANFPGGSYSTCGYIALPSYLISSGFTNITVEFWFTWNGGAAQQSVFDFGDSYKGNDPHVYSSGKDYIMFTPRRISGNGGWSEFRAVDDGASFFSTICYQSVPQTFTTNVEHHVVAEFAPAINYQALYLDGVLQQISTTPAVGAGTNLSRLHDPNVWLGVSQQWNEPPLNGRLNELRIYDGVLNDADIALSREAGPDALPVPRPALSFSVSGSNLILSWPTNSGNVALMSSPTLGTNATWNPAGSPTVVGQNYQVTVPITNTSFYFRLQQ